MSASSFADEDVVLRRDGLAFDRDRCHGMIRRGRRKTGEIDTVCVLCEIDFFPTVQKAGR